MNREPTALDALRPALLIFALAVAGMTIGVVWGGRSDRLAATTTSVMLQAMERGYQCHAAGRRLDDCQQEQRLRWANQTDLPPFGSKP